jgi:hypothetical protein
MHNRSLEYENQQIQSLLQAMCGAISANMLGISLQCIGQDVHLYFVLEHDSVEDREEIEDIVFKLSALQQRNVSIEVHISVLSGPWKGMGSLMGRPIYVRRVLQT